MPYVPHAACVESTALLLAIHRRGVHVTNTIRQQNLENGSSSIVTNYYGVYISAMVMVQVVVLSGV